MPPLAVSQQSDGDSIFLWVHYKPEEVNDGYWSVYCELALPASLITIFCTAFALGVGGVVANINSFDPVNGLLLVVLAAFVFPPLLCLYAYLLLRARMMKSYENRPNFQFPMMYTLSPLGCQIEYASGAGLLDWSHFSLALESPGAFCLASNIEDVFVLPKRCLGSESEVNRVRDLLKGHVREFRRARGRNVEIAFEKAEIQMIIDEGINKVVKAAEEAEGQIEEHHHSDLGGVNSSLVFRASEDAAEPVLSDLPNPSNPSDSSESQQPTPLQFASPLKSGLAVEIAYLPGEIMKAEKIYFFRKRLIALATIYIAYIIWTPLSFLAIGSIWGMLDYCRDLLSQIRPYVALTIPVFLLQALIIYFLIKRRTKLSEDYAAPFVFQFTEEGCGVRAGERYAVLAWWHFRECWETEDQFLVLVGQRGHAMYVIPKRVFPDQAGLRYLKQLLMRKIPKYRDLMG